MSDEFENLSDRIPDMNSLIKQRIADKYSPTSPLANKSTMIDPYQMMLNKKNKTETQEIDPSTIPQWPKEDIAKVEDYCKRMGIVGFNCGRMHPIAALRMLKTKFGEMDEDYTGVPLENRIPPGYQKMGTKSEAVQTKQILHG